ncbi:MAG: hypothetical protein WC400_03685 [Patescibacteria group bacterium]|jgi:hypothetical protein
MKKTPILALVAVQFDEHVTSPDDLAGLLAARGLKGAATDALDYLRDADPHILFAAPASCLDGYRSDEFRMQVRRGGGGEATIYSTVCYDKATGWKLPLETRFLAWQFGEPENVSG